MAKGNEDQQWIDLLSEEDLTFIKRFVLASGSLKGLAEFYGISYPTVRLRLDRMIQKINVIDDHTISSEFERLVRSLYAEGRMDMATVKVLLRAYREDKES